MDSSKDLYFKRNVFGVSVVEFFWGLGIPIVLESTFLQLFLKKLGASSFAIGIVPSMFMVGISCFPLFASYLSRGFRYKKSLVILLHLTSSFSIIIFGATLLLLKQTQHILPLFFFSYAVFSICMGLTIPVWLNYLLRIFSEAKAVPGLGYMMLCQNSGKIISSFFILKVVEKYSFSISSSAWIFIVTGLLFLVGSLSFLVTKELADREDGIPEHQSFVTHVRTSIAEILANRKFLVFLTAADIEFIIIITTLSFYANYATSYYGIHEAVAAGAFVAFIYAGSITVNIFLGTMNLLSLKQKFILSKFVCFSALVLLAWFPSYPVFFIASYMLGFVRAIRNMVYPPSVKKFAGRDDATSYFAFASILMLPFSAGYPLIFGRMLDYLSYMEQHAYKIVFSCSALIVLLTLFLAFKTDYGTEGSGS